MKLSRSTLIVVVIALLVVMAGVVQVIARGLGGQPADRDICCPTYSSTGTSHTNMPQPMGMNPHAKCPASDIPATSVPSDKCPHTRGSNSK